MRIGNLSIGMSLDTVKKFYGRPSNITTAHGAGTTELIYKSQGFTVSGNPVWQVNVSSPFSGSTPRGVHIGSAISDVEKAYPKITKFNNQGGVFLIESSEDKMYQISFQTKNNVVTQIMLTRSMPYKS